MERTYKAFEVDKVVPLKNKDYYWFLLSQIKKAQNRIWASVFLIDVYRSSDILLEVRTLIKELAIARTRGLDIRLITGRAADNPVIREMNMVSRSFMRSKGFRLKFYGNERKPRIHDKFIIFDDQLFIIGSHNWMHESFNNSLEDSLAVYSRDLTNRLEIEFLETWQNLKGKQAP